MKEAVGKFKAIITEGGGEIVNEDDWGLRKLAYPIKNKTTGFYYLIEFQSPGDVVQKLEIAFKRDEKVIRFLTVKLDKYALAYSEKRRKLKKDAEKEPQNEPLKTE
jgi:small subunit ribosomal protein S6